MMKVRKIIGPRGVCRVCKAKTSQKEKTFYRVFFNSNRDIKRYRQRHGSGAFVLCEEHLLLLAVKIREAFYLGVNKA